MKIIQVNNWIREDTDVPSSILIEMSILFGTTIDYLLGIKEGGWEIKQEAVPEGRWERCGFQETFAELLLRRIDDLERRVKRLEQLEYETCKNKIASLKNEESGKENALAIEEIINKFERAANSSKRLERRW